ncbi:MAG: hypothetical protein V1725_05450 [archaeon]
MADRLYEKILSAKPIWMTGERGDVLGIHLVLQVKLGVLGMQRTEYMDVSLDMAFELGILPSDKRAEFEKMKEDDLKTYFENNINNRDFQFRIISSIKDKAEHALKNVLHTPITAFESIISRHPHKQHIIDNITYELHEYELKRDDEHLQRALTYAAGAIGAYSQEYVTYLLGVLSHLQNDIADHYAGLHPNTESKSITLWEREIDKHTSAVNDQLKKIMEWMTNLPHALHIKLEVHVHDRVAFLSDPKEFNVRVYAHPDSSSLIMHDMPQKIIDTKLKQQYDQHMNKYLNKIVEVHTIGFSSPKGLPAVFSILEPPRNYYYLK